MPLTIEIPDEIAAELGPDVFERTRQARGLIALELYREGKISLRTMGRFAGVGGFMNIAQSARKVVFCCTFRAGDLEVAMDGDRLVIVKEGRHPKFVERVQHVCFHGPSALARGQRVLYVTERAVFELTVQGLKLVEHSPGIDLQTQVLDQMQFTPLLP